MLILGAVVAVWMLHRPGVQERIVAELLPRLESTLGREIDVDRVRFRLFPLAVEIEGLEIAGAEPGDPSLATAERIRLEADWADLGRDRIRIQSLEGEGIDFHLERYAEGGDNLPRPGRGRDRPPRRRVEVSLGALRIRDSRFVYEDHRVSVDLVARHVRTDLVAVGDRQIQGTVVVEEVDLKLPRSDPYRAAVTARVLLDRRGLRIRKGRINSPETALRAHGEIVWKGDQRVRIDFEGQAEAELFRRLGYVGDQVEGTLDLNGSFVWNEGVWGFRGLAESSRLRLAEWWLQDVDAVVAGDRNGLSVDLRRSRYGGGRVEGLVEVDLTTEEPDTVVRLGLDGIDAERLLADAGIPVVGIEARLVGELDYRFRRGDWEAGNGWGDFQVEARARSRGDLPLTGRIPLTVDDGRVAVRVARFRAPSQEIGAEADFDLNRREGEIRFEIESRDLGPLADLIPVEGEVPPLWLPRRGRGTITGSLLLEGGAVRAPLYLALRQLRAPGLAADRAEGRLTVTGKAVENLRLELEQGESAAFVTGRFPFAGPQFRLTVDAASWAVREIRPWIDFELPVAGLFTGGLSIRPEQEGGLRGRVAGIVAEATVSGVPLDRIELRLTWNDEEVLLEDAVFLGEAGRVEVAGRLGLEGRSLDFTASGSELELEKAPLGAYLGDGRLAGRLAVSGRLRGTLDSPRGRMILTATDLTLEGRSLGAENEAAVLDLTWGEGRLDVEGSLLGLARIEGGGELDRDAVDVAVDYRVPEVHRLLELVGESEPRVQGEAEGSFRVRGSPSAPDLSLRVEHLAVTVADRPVVNLDPVVLELQPERIRIESLYLGGPSGESEIFVTGTVGLTGAHALDLRVQASVANRWIDPWIPGARLRGSTDLLGSVRGSLADPELSGQAEVRDGDLLLDSPSLRVDELRAVLLAYPGFLVLDSAEGEIGGGTVRATGRIDWATEEKPARARVQTAMDDVTVRYPEGWLLRGSGELVWSLGPDGQLIRGLVDLDRAYYLRDIEVGVVQLLQRFFRHQRREVEKADEELAAVELNVLIQAPGTVRIKNNLANLSARAELTARGTLARPILFGRAEAGSGGTLVYNDNRYIVERASLVFANPYRMEPVLDLVARTEVAEYDVTLSLFGPLDRLAATFSSDPPLPDLEVLSLLVAGSPTELSAGFSGLGAGRGASTSAAEGLLFGQAASLISERVGALFGFDAFRIEPLSTSGGQVSSARVTVGKRFSSRLYVTYSYDPSTTDEQRIQAEYRLGEGWLVRLTQEGDDYTVDFLRERRF